MPEQPSTSAAVTTNDPCAVPLVPPITNNPPCVEWITLEVRDGRWW